MVRARDGPCAPHPSPLHPSTPPSPLTPFPRHHTCRTRPFPARAMGERWRGVRGEGGGVKGEERRAHREREPWANTSCMISRARVLGVQRVAYRVLRHVRVVCSVMYVSSAASCTCRLQRHVRVICSVMYVSSAASCTCHLQRHVRVICSVMYVSSDGSLQSSPISLLPVSSEPLSPAPFLSPHSPSSPSLLPLCPNPSSPLLSLLASLPSRPALAPSSALTPLPPPPAREQAAHSVRRGTAAHQCSNHAAAYHAPLLPVTTSREPDQTSS